MFLEVLSRLIVVPLEVVVQFHRRLRVLSGYYLLRKYSRGREAGEQKVDKLVAIEQKDIFTLDLGEADVIVLYLLPKLNTKLIPQLTKLKAGSRIVSHQF